MLAYEYKTPDVTLAKLKHLRHQMYPSRKLKCSQTLRNLQYWLSGNSGQQTRYPKAWCSIPTASHVLKCWANFSFLVDSTCPTVMCTWKEHKSFFLRGSSHLNACVMCVLNFHLGDETAQVQVPMQGKVTIC